MLLAFELQPLFGFALKSKQRKWEQQWCSSNAKVLRIAAAYTHCEPAAAASLTLITTEGDITISKGAARGSITRQQCKSHTAFFQPASTAWENKSALLFNGGLLAVELTVNLKSQSPSLNQISLGSFDDVIMIPITGCPAKNREERRTHARTHARRHAHSQILGCPPTAQYASILSPVCASMDVEQTGPSDLEIISQPVEDENQYLAPPVQLVSFGYRDLPLAALDLSLAGSQLLSNADEDENREGTAGLLVITPVPLSPHYCIDLPLKQTAAISLPAPSGAFRSLSVHSPLVRVKVEDFQHPTTPTLPQHLSSGMMSPPIPVMGVWLPDAETEAYVADTAIPNVQGVQAPLNLTGSGKRSNWLKPCCGRRVALWQVCLLSAGFNCILVACVILVVLFLSLELLIDTKLLQFTEELVVLGVSNAFQFASIIHWISLIILSLFFSENCEKQNGEFGPQASTSVQTNYPDSLSPNALTKTLITSEPEGEIIKAKLNEQWGWGYSDTIHPNTSPTDITEESSVTTSWSHGTNQKTGFEHTVFRIVVLGIWDYIENKVEVFDGAVIVLSLAPMVASTVANGPSSPWDAISLIITLRIWRVKRIIDAYVLQVKVEMELEIQQCEKTKAVREEQLERLTQICQEQAVSTNSPQMQLRAHLAQQDLDLAAEREAAMQIHHIIASKYPSVRLMQ
ncbi:hypothetical protein FQN60_010730 [Etheostoma spectabile]|uniref:Ion transport domain-containing protein n=1 Tax=Etheostoma spectabile TaxID=54343 RepID=A0A5J5DQ47_9PERO|nr:hypothetical protein FQN60_010730 [Etheostoma spectabile]